MTMVWSVKPDWNSYTGDASMDDHGEWPQTWTDDVETPPWKPRWGDVLSPLGDDLSPDTDPFDMDPFGMDEDDIAFELHTSVFQVSEGDLTTIYIIPLDYEHIWKIRLYIRELEDNGLDGTEDQEDQGVAAPPVEDDNMTPRGRTLAVLYGSGSGSDSESEIGLTDGSGSEEEEDERALNDVYRTLFPDDGSDELRVPQQVKDNCREGLRIVEDIMDRADRRMNENDFVELCNIFKDVFQMKGSDEVVS